MFSDVSDEFSCPSPGGRHEKERVEGRFSALCDEIDIKTVIERQKWSTEGIKPVVTSE